MSMDAEDILSGYMTPEQLLEWAKARLNIIGPNTDMTDNQVRLAMRWIGFCAIDTVLDEGGKPKLGRVGIGLMLFVTLVIFPDFYMKYELAQVN